MKCYSYNFPFRLTKSKSWENQRQLRQDCCCPMLQSSPALFCLGRTLPAYMMRDAGQQGLRVASTPAFCPSPYFSQCISTRANASYICGVKIGLLWCSLSCCHDLLMSKLGILLHWLWGEFGSRTARVTVNTKDYSFANANLQKLTRTSKICLPFGLHNHSGCSQTTAAG